MAGPNVATRTGPVPVAMPDAMTGMQMGGPSAMYTALLEKRIAGRRWDWYQYSAQWLPLVASAPATPRTIQIDADADFLAIACVGTARATPAPAAQNADTPFLITMRNSAGGFVFDEATDWAMVVGTAQRPAWWGLPRLMALGSTYVITLQNLAAVDNNVRVAFWGIKVYV